MSLFTPSKLPNENSGLTYLALLASEPKPSDFDKVSPMSLCLIKSEAIGISVCLFVWTTGTAFTKGDKGLYTLALSPKSPPTFKLCRPICLTVNPGLSSKNLPIRITSLAVLSTSVPAPPLTRPISFEKKPPSGPHLSPMSLII